MFGPPVEINGTGIQPHRSRIVAAVPGHDDSDGSEEHARLAPSENDVYPV